MVEACQYGVSRRAEARVHIRETIESAIRGDLGLGVRAVVDFDFQNTFPFFYYEAIGSALGTKVPELRQWSKLCQDH